MTDLEIEPQTVECPHAAACGACTFLGLEYAAQLRSKERLLGRALAQFRSLDKLEVEPCLASRNVEGYRNRAKMAVGLSKFDPASLGYFQPKSREIEDAPHCRVLRPELLQTTRGFRKLLRSQRRTPKALRHIDLRCGSDPRQQHLTLVFRSREMPPVPVDAIRKACPAVHGISVNLNPSSGSQVIKGPIEHQWGDREIYVALKNLSLRVSPGSFFQVNLGVLPKIHLMMKEFFGTGDSLLDLYSGVGTHGFALASDFQKITAVEGVRSSVADAKATARRYKISHMKVVPKPVERSVQALLDADAEAVIMNPSRAGAKQAVLEALLASPARKIAYLSCHPDTLARDLDHLVRGGFRAISARPIDMMPQTRQVEALVLLSRRS